MVGLYQEGASDREVCRALKITYASFDKRYNSDPIFHDLVDYGRLAAFAWWLELGRMASAGRIKGFNFPAWYANMKNRFGWSDKVENVSSDDKPINQLSQDELVSRIAKYKDKLSTLIKTENFIYDGNTTSN